MYFKAFRNSFEGFLREHSYKPHIKLAFFETTNINSMKMKVKLLHKCEAIKGFKLYLLWLVHYNKMTATRNVKPKINKLNMSGGTMVTWNHLTLKPLKFDLFSNMGNSQSMYEGRLFLCLFHLSHWNLSNQSASYHDLGTIGKPN
jgi:hypothetical protein